MINILNWCILFVNYIEIYFRLSLADICLCTSVIQSVACLCAEVCMVDDKK